MLYCQCISTLGNILQLVCEWEAFPMDKIKPFHCIKMHHRYGFKCRVLLGTHLLFADFIFLQSPGKITVVDCAKLQVTQLSIQLSVLLLNAIWMYFLCMIHYTVHCFKIHQKFLYNSGRGQMQCEYAQKYLLLQFCGLLQQENYLKVHNDFICAAVLCVQCVHIEPKNIY